jgi:hypothetical protein
MNTLNYLGNHILYHWVFLILMAPIVIVALLLRFLLDSIEITAEIQLGLFLSIFLTFVWIVFAGYVGHMAARNRVVKGMGYLEARERAWLDTRAELAFFPLVGRLFRK